MTVICVITKAGLQIFWKTLDSSVAFNIKKREEYVTHLNYRVLLEKRSNNSNTNTQEKQAHVKNPA